MPHLPPPEQTYEPGMQWREGAEERTVKHSSEYRSGRGYPAAAAPRPLGPPMIDDATMSRVVANMKRAGHVDIKSCGCGLDSPPHSH